jgi:hypothetical protein
MTWGEFKRQVEAAGVTDSDEIHYIEVEFPRQLHISTGSPGIGVLGTFESEDW